MNKYILAALASFLILFAMATRMALADEKKVVPLAVYGHGYDSHHHHDDHHRSYDGYRHHPSYHEYNRHYIPYFFMYLRRVTITKSIGTIRPTTGKRSSI